MNERIKELWSQTVRNYGHSGQEICAQQFAELILTEVTDILATYRMKAIFVDGIEYNCQHPIYAIRKHFGVES